MQSSTQWLCDISFICLVAQFLIRIWTRGTSFPKIYKFCASTGWCTIFTILINHQGGILSADIYAQKPLYCPIGLNECIKIRWKQGMVSVELSMVANMGNWETFSRPRFLHCSLVIQTRNTKKKITTTKNVLYMWRKIKLFVYENSRDCHNNCWHVAKTKWHQ